jgi:hypothetical protein
MQRTRGPESLSPITLRKKIGITCLHNWSDSPASVNRTGNVRPIFFEQRRKGMKTLLALALTLASIGFAAPAAEAKGEFSIKAKTILANSNAPQFGRQDRWGRRSHRGRTVIQTRYVRYGRRVFRETYLVRYLPFGRVETRLIDRQRIR